VERLVADRQGAALRGRHKQREDNSDTRAQEPGHLERGVDRPSAREETLDVLTGATVAARRLPTGTSSRRPPEALSLAPASCAMRPMPKGSTTTSWRAALGAALGNRTARVGVVGLGYVGLPMLVSAVGAGYRARGWTSTPSASPP
jgi:hypothetical protein